VNVSEVAAASDELLWKVRYTWVIARELLPHPQYTYEQWPDETRAIDRAVSNMDRNGDRASAYIVCAHIQRPGSEGWRRVEYTS
jgi:hypothetical protein